jgi:hypothetical protein
MVGGRRLGRWVPGNGGGKEGKKHKMGNQHRLAWQRVERGSEKVEERERGAYPKLKDIVCLVSQGIIHCPS